MMKTITQLLTALVFCSLVIFISCGDDDSGSDTDPRDAAAEALAGTWSPTTVTFNGENRTEWDGFSITFSYNADTDQGTYTVAGVPTNDGADAVWGSSPVTWNFQGTSADDANTGIIERAGDLPPMTVTVNDEETVLTLSFDNSPAARTAGFEGAWVFTAAKQ